MITCNVRSCAGMIFNGYWARYCAPGSCITILFYAGNRFGQWCRDNVATSLVWKYNHTSGVFEQRPSVYFVIRPQYRLKSPTEADWSIPKFILKLKNISDECTVQNNVSCWFTIRCLIECQFVPSVSFDGFILVRLDERDIVTPSTRHSLFRLTTKENIIINGPLWEECSCDRWTAPTKDQ